MTTMIQWEPFNELRATMDRLFDQGFSRPWRLLPTTDYQAAFPVDVWESDSAIHVAACLPGARPEDVNITVAGETLTIKAQHASTAEDNRTYYVREIDHGDFQRTFTLPVSVEADRAEARYEYGMLYLTLPKAEALRPKQIKVSPAGNGQHMLN